MNTFLLLFCHGNQFSGFCTLVVVSIAHIQIISVEQEKN
jgi:hypothetical protein